MSTAFSGCGANRLARLPSVNSARVAQGIEHRFPKAGVGGSNPPVGAIESNPKGSGLFSLIKSPDPFVRLIR